MYKIDWALQRPIPVRNNAEWKLPKIRVSRATILIVVIVAISLVGAVHGSTVHPNDPVVWPSFAGGGGGRPPWVM